MPGLMFLLWLCFEGQGVCVLGVEVGEEAPYDLLLPDLQSCVPWVKTSELQLWEGGRPPGKGGQFFLPP